MWNSPLFAKLGRKWKFAQTTGTRNVHSSISQKISPFLNLGMNCQTFETSVTNFEMPASFILNLRKSVHLIKCQTFESCRDQFENSASFLPNCRKLPQISEVGKDCQTFETLRFNFENLCFFPISWNLRQSTLQKISTVDYWFQNLRNSNLQIFDYQVSVFQITCEN